MSDLKSSTSIFALKASRVADWSQPGAALSFLVIKSSEADRLDKKIHNLFGNELAKVPESQTKFLFRSYLPGVSNPLAESLARVLKLPSRNIRVDQALEITRPLQDGELARMEALWREPAIETLTPLTFAEYLAWLENLRTPKRTDNSFDSVRPEEIGLEFSDAERRALDEAAKSAGRSWNRAEWELFAQTWSEHCKHKIFNAHIELTEERTETNSIFKSKLRKPALAETEKRPELFLSLFHDNAGVLRIYNPAGEPTEMAIAAKMETHNSPSAISPYGGASTGVVGVHRDILGTGLGALPIANWDVLCFESPSHREDRPATALAPEIIRRGVLRGIQDGGNQSGIPTVQGSVIFDPSYAVKPLVYAGALGILDAKYVIKKPLPGDTLFCIGGATGADGLRGAVMSSRDIRTEDFSGSIVQVANPYTQRCVTDFLIEARDRGLLTAVTDNGAGGLASSVGEMSTLTNGATIDLSQLRLKFEGLLEWEKLLSESQERMTLATRQPAELKALLREWRVEFDELGTLNDSGRFVVNSGGKKLIDLSLEVLHDLCPQMKLRSGWTFAQEKVACAPKAAQQIGWEDFLNRLKSPEGASREKILRRFDHEVQGRTLKKPFAGRTQESPGDGSLLEIPEARSYVALGHGLAPTEPDFALSVLTGFDEAMKRYLLASGQLRFAALLDNFSWPDPIKNDRSLWKLELSGEILARITGQTGIPFVSGKDSMKNNDAKFRILETLVISAFGSALGPDRAPPSFLAAAGQKIFHWPALDSSLVTRAQNRSELLALSDAGCAKLLARYRTLEKWIQDGVLLAAKDTSAQLPLKSLFEMCLGRRLGIRFEGDLERYARTGSALGSLQLVFRPDFDPRASAPDLELVGESQAEFEFADARRKRDLRAARDAYLSAGEEGLWA